MRLKKHFLFYAARVYARISVQMRAFIIVVLCGCTLYIYLARVQGLAVCVLGFRLVLSLRVGDNLDATKENVDPSSPWHFALKKRLEG